MSLPSDHSFPTNCNTPASHGDVTQAQQHLGWWFDPTFIDPQLGDMQIVLATIPLGGSKAIHFHAFESRAEAARTALDLSMRSNVYTHIAAHAPDRPNGKGSHETALALPGLAADLDACSPYRASNEGKAPDLTSLALVVADFEQHMQCPLTVIESGFGLYACVRFREPWWLDNRAARQEADNLLARFAEGFRIFGRKRGWPNTVDRVPLAGLIRVAGTLNRKSNPAILVRFRDANNGASK